MKKLAIPLFAIILSQIVLTPAGSGDSQAKREKNWLMMVTTQSTDPAREAEFNAWYDDIDIPDVLEVPGYRRARRGLGQKVPDFPAADLQDDEGTYVALYDIETDNMDKTIIDMMLASRKMEMTGRSTDLLKVVERVYYRQYAPSAEAPQPKPSGKNQYLYIVKVVCCRDEATGKEFHTWYDKTHIPDILKTEGFMRATRYELHRVVMVEPKDIPNFLTVYEIEADSAEQAIQDMSTAVEALREAGRMSELYVEGGATIYLKIKDVQRYESH